jgi:hypothetical protein
MRNRMVCLAAVVFEADGPGVDDRIGHSKSLSVSLSCAGSRESLSTESVFVDV